METRTRSYTNAFGEEQEVMEFRIKNGDGSNQYVEVHALLNAFAESTLNFLKVEEVIKSVPTADVAPVVHGEWIKIDKRGKNVQCSKCGNTLDLRGVNTGRGDANYCPNCGARMDGEEE